MNDIEALKAAMRTSQVSGKGQYIGDGIHLLEVERAFCKRTNISGTWKEAYIVEFKVLESSNPTHDVGSTRSYVENPANQGWDGRFKAFVLAAMGFDPNLDTAETKEVFPEIVAMLRYDEYRVSKGLPENFLKGKVLRCEGMPGQSRKGTPVTNKKWTTATKAAA